MWHWPQLAPAGPEKTEPCHSAKVRSIAAPFGVTMSWQAPHSCAESWVSRSCSAP